MKVKCRWIDRMITNSMKDGKKSIARKLVYSSLANALNNLLKEKTPELIGVKIPEALHQLLKKVMININTTHMVRKCRISGQNYQVPEEIGPSRQESTAIKRLIKASRNNKSSNFIDSLSNILITSYKNEGLAVALKEEEIKKVKDNQAYSHYRIWGKMKKKSEFKLWEGNVEITAA